MKFSERHGHTSIRTQILFEKIDTTLRVGIWNIIYDSIITTVGPRKLPQFTYALWTEHWVKPVDESPIDRYNTLDRDRLEQVLKHFILKASTWYECYDFVEFCCSYMSEYNISRLNEVLQKGFSGYRVVNKIVIPLTSDVEVNEIEESLNNSAGYPSITSHLTTAMEMLADRRNPDFRNSVKESISAVEAVCKLVVQKSNSTLGEALTELEKKGSLHPALKKAFTSLYGYASENGGIRHALTEKSTPVDLNEARFMLIACSAFVNYMTSKLA